MSRTIEIESIRGEIAAALRAAERLKMLGEDFPALCRNAARVLASLKMLEINISDLYELGILDAPRDASGAAGGGAKTAAGPGEPER
jgi:hypothetical protein